MFNAEMFAGRRRRLLELMRPDSLAIVPTGPELKYSHDTDTRYRPDSDFYFLTGFREPESCALLSNSDSDKPFTIFVRPRDPAKETWTGRRVGVERVCELFGADEAFDIAELDEKLPGYMANKEAIYHFPGKQRVWDIKVLDAWQKIRMKWREGTDAPSELFDLGHLMYEMRLFKTVEDMEFIRRACRITSEALELAMRATRPGMNERELEALLEHYFRANGAFGPAFPTIVASGPNACILHYTENDRDLKKNDLVLVDCGCEYEMFNSDITRTFPVSGKFTPEQRAVYDIVLAANRAGFELCTTGKSPNDMHDGAVVVLVDGLIGLELIEGPADKAIEEGTYKKYYMHKTGHWLGVDVHDVGSMRKNREWRKFEPGMVTTVEPGLYLPEDDETIPDGFRGIGVRIEDDVLITSGAPENLTLMCPKKTDELEEICSGS
jgi:Xaa-Pro aminopeptidase